jgi:hypothetical protein
MIFALPTPAQVPVHGTALPAQQLGEVVHRDPGRHRLGQFPVQLGVDRGPAFGEPLLGLGEPPVPVAFGPGEDPEQAALVGGAARSPKRARGLPTWSPRAGSSTPPTGSSTPT